MHTRPTSASSPPSLLLHLTMSHEHPLLTPVGSGGGAHRRSLDILRSTRNSRTNRGVGRDKFVFQERRALFLSLCDSAWATFSSSTLPLSTHTFKKRNKSFTALSYGSACKRQPTLIVLSSDTGQASSGETREPLLYLGCYPVNLIRDVTLLTPAAMIGSHVQCMGGVAAI